MSLKNSLRYTRFLKRIHSISQTAPQQSPLSFLSGYVSKLETTTSSNDSKQLSNLKEGTSSNGLVSVKVNYLGQLVHITLNAKPNTTLDKKSLETSITDACNAAWKQFRDEGMKELHFDEEHLWALKPPDSSETSL